MSMLGEGSKAVGHVAEAMKSTPLALALIIVNASFIGFSGYMLHEVAAVVRERNAAQSELIKNIVEECVAKQSSKTSIHYRSRIGRTPAPIAPAPVSPPALPRTD